MNSPELFADLKSTPKNIDRDIQDEKFYALQDKLNSNKAIAGINMPSYCSGGHLNIRERFLELENIHNYLANELTTIEVSLDLAESDNEMQIDTGLLIKRSILLQQNIESVLAVFNKLSEDRSFLPLLYPNYEDYSRNVNHFDFNVYFLDKVFTKQNSKIPDYSKVAFDNTELQKVIEIMLGSYNPKDVVKRLAQFFNINPNKLALTYFNSRFGGFTVYIDPENKSLESKLMFLGNSHPNNFQYTDNDPSWVFNFENTDVMDSGVIADIDVWFDLDQCIAYVANQCLPIDFELNVPIEYDLNKDYLKCLYFDYVTEARLLHRHDLINKLRELIPKENPKHLEIFNGEEFELFNHYRIWSFSEYILIRYKIGSDITKQAVFETKDLVCHISGYVTDDLSVKLLKLFTNNLYLLKISGFEKYNPYILVNDPSTPFEEMI